MPEVRRRPPARRRDRLALAKRDAELPRAVREKVREVADLVRLDARHHLVHRGRVADAPPAGERAQRLLEIVLALAGDARHLPAAGIVIAVARRAAITR